MASAKNAVRVFVGTKKGAYVLESDRSRKKWKVAGPMHEGGDVFHVAPDPRSPGHVYALVNSPFWGPMLYRSTNWGSKWTEIAPPMVPKRSERPPPSDDGSPAKFAITNLWHLEPGPADEPKTVFIGVDPGRMYRSDDSGTSWAPMDGLNEHETRPKWNPGAGGMAVHTILLDPENPKRMYVGISAAGTFRSDDGGEKWRPVNKGVKVSFLPDPFPEVGQCVHHVALDPADPTTSYRQDHDGIYVSHDSMESWKHVGGKLDSDFGFVVATAPAMPGSAFFVPLEGSTRTVADHGFQVVRWDDKPKKFVPLVKGKPFVGDFGIHRESIATDSLDPPGIYVGSTTGDVFFSADGGKKWGQVPYRFPSIHSVTAASPAAGR